MGWLGDRVHLTELGGQNGIMRGNIVNQFLRQAYGGVDPAVAAQKAAEALLGS